MLNLHVDLEFVKLSPYLHFLVCDTVLLFEYVFLIYTPLVFLCRVCA